MNKSYKKLTEEAIENNNGVVKGRKTYTRKCVFISIFTGLAKLGIKENISDYIDKIVEKKMIGVNEPFDGCNDTHADLIENICENYKVSIYYHCSFIPRGKDFHIMLEQKVLWYGKEGLPVIHILDYGYEHCVYVNWNIAMKLDNYDYKP